MNNSVTRTLFWIGFVALFVLALRLLSSILLPFVLGAILAFMLDPLVGWMHRMRIPRPLGTLAALAGLILLIVAVVLLLVPLFETQIAQLVQHFPSYLDQARGQLDRLLSFAEHNLPPDDFERLRDAANAKVGEVLGGAGEVLGGVLTGGMAVANVLSLVFITPIVTFFLLRDWPQVIGAIDSWLPRQHVRTIREQVHLVEEALSGFIRGQAAVCLLFGAFYAIGLSLIGLQSGLVIGFCIGLLIFIPFLGALAGGILTSILAFAQFGGWHEPIYVVILFVVGQTLEGNIVTPKLVGDRIHLHPLWLIFSLLAFGALFGFVGVLIAVPVAAVLGVLLRFALKGYLLSTIYDPLNGPPATTDA